MLWCRQPEKGGKEPNEKSKKQKELENIVNQSELNKPVGIIHLEMVRESRSLYGTGPFTSPEKAVEMVKPLLVKADREMVVVVSLSAKLDALATEVVAVGGLDSCCIDVRNIYKHSLLNNAASINYSACFSAHICDTGNRGGDASTGIKKYPGA